MQMIIIKKKSPILNGWSNVYSSQLRSKSHNVTNLQKLHVEETVYIHNTNIQHNIYITDEYNRVGD